MFNKARYKFYRWLRDADNGNECVPILESRGSLVKRLRGRSGSKSIDGMDNTTLDVSGIYFKVIPGRGGIAIEVQSYDTKTERDITTLHVIPEDEELSEALSKIITLESMRR